MTPVAPRKAAESFLKAVRAEQGVKNVFTNRPPENYLLYSQSPRYPDVDSKMILVKDNICTHGQDSRLPTTCGSRLLEAYESPFEATAVRLLRETGWGIIAGKTNLDEFGMGSHSIFSGYGAVKRRSQRSAGGSSGGSAVAVAAGFCDGALGTDTGGSVRLPAAYNGVYGFKPSYGRISRWGVVAYANSLDTVGILGRDISQIKVMYDRIASHDPLDPTSLSPTTRARIRLSVSKRNELRERNQARQDKLVIGVPIEYNVEEMDEVVRKSWARTLSALQHQGHNIQPISLPTTRQALSAYYVIAPAEASSNLAKYDGVRYGISTEEQPQKGWPLYAQTRSDKLGPEVRRRILLGSFSLSAEAIDNYFLQAQRVRRLVQRDFDSVFALPNPLAKDPSSCEHYGDDVLKSTSLNKVDVIVTPTATGPPPLMDDVRNRKSPIASYLEDIMTVPASLAGLPAVSVPFPSTADGSEHGSKVGIQLITQFGDDRLALSAANVLTSALLEL